MSTLFGPVRQIGYVVPDVQAAIRSWIDVFGVGPFFTIPRFEVQNYEFGGVRTNPTLGVAVAYSGQVQIELIQPLDETPSHYRTLLAQGGPGPHYVTYWVRDLAKHAERCSSAGCKIVQSGGQEGLGRFAYFSTPDGRLFELLETNEFIEGWYAAMQGAAETWDGSDPIRPAMP